MTSRARVLFLEGSQEAPGACTMMRLWTLCGTNIRQLYRVQSRRVASLGMLGSELLGYLGCITIPHQRVISTSAALVSTPSN